MKCVFVIKSLVAEGGGAERVLVEVVNGLVARGHDLRVVTFDPPDAETFYSIDPRVERLGLSIGRKGAPTPRFELLAGLGRLRRAVSSSGPAVVVGFMHSAYVPLALAVFRSGLRLIASEHAGKAHFEGRALERVFVSLTAHCFVGKTVPSDRMRLEHHESQRRKIAVLPNPLDDRRFAQARRTEECWPPVLLCVAGFRQEKGHETLIHAFARVAADFPAWTLRLVGGGTLRDEIQKLVEKLDLVGRVVMPGFRADVENEYAGAAAVVIPSLYESFGLAAVEALACARPIVGFADALAPLGIVEHGVNAILVDGVGDRVSGLAQGLREVMADASLRRRLGEAGPPSVRCFGAEAVVDKWEAYLRQCAGLA